jgi:hypothetical protein
VRHDERREAVLPLIVGADRQIRLAGDDTDERDPQLVAQEPQQVQGLAAALPAGREQA